MFVSQRGHRKEGTSCDRVQTNRCYADALDGTTLRPCTSIATLHSTSYQRNGSSSIRQRTNYPWLLLLFSRTGNCAACMMELRRTAHHSAPRAMLLVGRRCTNRGGICLAPWKKSLPSFSLLNCHRRSDSADCGRLDAATGRSGVALCVRYQTGNGMESRPKRKYEPGANKYQVRCMNCGVSVLNTSSKIACTVVSPSLCNAVQRTVLPPRLGLVLHPICRCRSLPISKQDDAFRRGGSDRILCCM